MRKITLLFCLVFIGVLNAQSVYEISWEQGISNSAASPTIERGDTVIWTWTGDGTFKSVSSLSNGTETFDSGMLKGSRSSFSHTFTNVGVTRYRNDNNSEMRGRVTVVDKLSQEEKFMKNLSFYPNPVMNSLSISSMFKIESYQIYNVLGTLVAEGKAAGKITTIDMTALNSGLYFVKVVSGNMQTNIKVAKK